MIKSQLFFLFFGLTISFVYGQTPHSVGLGSGQNLSVAINSLYPVPLVALVEDANGNRLPGIAVTFTVPDSGPSLTFDGTGTTSLTVNTNANGAAVSSNMTPNSVVGSFLVTATVDGTSLAASTLYENLPMDLTPPMIANSYILGGNQSLTATQVTLVNDFDEISNDITQDDFELISTGTASGTITNFSSAIFGIRSRVTIIVGNISGDGSLSIRLKASTDITDVPGNGNGTNGYATQAVSSTIHMVRFTPIETILTLSASKNLTIEDSGAVNNNNLSLSVSGTLLRVEDDNSVLGGAGTFVTNHIRSLPLSSIESIIILSHNGTDTVTLEDALNFSGGAGLIILGNTAVLQNASITLENGAIGYEVIHPITLAAGGGVLATGDSTIEMLSTSSITINASIRNTALSSNNSIYLVSGWDGSPGGINPTLFNGFNSVSALTGTTPFGNNGASILLGDGSQTTSVTVGSRAGSTGLYGYSIILTGGQGGSNRFAQLGYTTSDQGSTYTVGGALILRAKQDLRLIGGGDTNPYNYAQIGHVGADATSDPTIEATVNASIDCAVGNEIYISGGGPRSNYAQLGHGGYSAMGFYTGLYLLRTPEVSLKLIGGSGQGYSRLGNDPNAVILSED